ncbi:MAG TPA: hypothetical protein VN429_10445 [Methanospirillum sp.]|uniref:hypothetical protein n=1 Tax=Methanospirillum sp. TaxID=45200 RepID=UPI002C6BC489|nr:hypothetical protein [Methanospirillum sp.]HWQ64824.1 hypothetical protein [Methanospirillum sp.]
MNKAFDYRTGAVQALPGFELGANGASIWNRRDIKWLVKSGKQMHPFYDLSMFSLKIVKKALKRIKKDYPHQKVRFGKFPQNGKIFLAIQPKSPTPPDQWMIIGQVVTS